VLQKKTAPKKQAERSFAKLTQEAIMTHRGESQEPAPPKKAETKKPKEIMPAAGPHARPELTNYDACPGSGALPAEHPTGRESDPGAG
jgi:hypothetical protein